jgi:hypothetical protein
VSKDVWVRVPPLALYCSTRTSGDFPGVLSFWREPNPTQIRHSEDLSWFESKVCVEIERLYIIRLETAKDYFVPREARCSIVSQVSSPTEIEGFEHVKRFALPSTPWSARVRIGQNRAITF